MTWINKVLSEIGQSQSQKKRMMERIRKAQEHPISIVGIGQSGVGKTELLRALFPADQIDEASRGSLVSGPAKSTTKEFSSFIITSKEGFRLKFTDGPGLGEDAELDETYFEMWCAEIPKNDILYWVMDAPNRDIAHIQRWMKRVVDATALRNKLVVVLNKVDNFSKPGIDSRGESYWDTDFNVPSPELSKVIEERTADITDKISTYVGISKDQIVACSALKRWNLDRVYELLISCIPEDQRIIFSSNRDVKSPHELMSDDAKEALREELQQRKNTSERKDETRS